MKFIHWPDECTFNDDCDCDQVAAQLAAVHATGRWSKFRESTVVCSDCGGVLAEVMGMSPESVIVTRAPVPPSDHPMASGANPVSAVYLHRPRASKSRRWWVRVSAGCELDLMCKCRVVTVPAGQVVSDTAGRRKATF